MGNHNNTHIHKNNELRICYCYCCLIFKPIYYNMISYEKIKCNLFFLLSFVPSHFTSAFWMKSQRRVTAISASGIISKIKIRRKMDYNPILPSFITIVVVACTLRYRENSTDRPDRQTCTPVNLIDHYLALNIVRFLCICAIDCIHLLYRLQCISMTQNHVNIADMQWLQ